VRRLVGCALVLLAALGALSLPSPARATTASEPAIGSNFPSTRFKPELSLRTADGYRVTVAEREDAVALTVMRRRRKESLTATSYVARGTANAHRLQASFGRFGRISMRFHASRAAARLEPGGTCRGILSLLVRRGVFVGTLRFRGEDGYVSIDAHRVAGTISRFPRGCLHHSRHHRSPHHRRYLLFGRANASRNTAEVPYLAANWRGATAARSFVALKTPSSVFLATSSEDAGRLSIFRLALEVEGAGDFRLSQALTQSSVSPARPFSGTATYRAAPDGSRTWEGSLAVDFPGTPRVPLTDPALQPQVGTIPPLFALFLLRDASSGDPLAARTKPTLLALLRPR
jgi:hypothetical protein